MGVYFLGPLTSPALGPVTGGLLVQRWGWRSLQWFLSAFAGSMLLSAIIFLPETKQNIPLGSREFLAAENLSVHPHDSPYQLLRSGTKAAIAALTNPLRAFGYLHYPLVAILLYLAALSYALTAIFAITVQSVFSAIPYNYDSLIVGLLFLPYAFGAIAASLFGGKWSDDIMRKRSVARAANSDAVDQQLVPEDRIQENAWVSFVIMPTALTILGWVLHAHLIWIVPVRYILR